MNDMQEVYVADFVVYANRMMLCMIDFCVHVR